MSQKLLAIVIFVGYVVLLYLVIWLEERRKSKRKEKEVKNGDR